MEETMNPSAAAGTAADPSQDIQPIEIPEGCYCPAVVVMCHPGTIDLMKRVWTERLTETELIFIELDSENETLLEQVGRALAHQDITPGFVLAPANLIPCSKITLDDLQIPVVYVAKDGKKTYGATVPMPFTVEDTQALIQELVTKEDPTPAELAELSEQFAATYAARHRTRALEVGLSFGNYISPVTRGTPCGNKVVEAMMRKKFLSANRVGFEAITSEIIMTLK